MGVLFALRPPLDTRVLVILRASLEAVARQLPPHVEPRACGGHAIVLVDFANRKSLAGGWQALIHRDDGAASQLVWRVPVVRSHEGRSWPELWVARRIASPTLAADWPRRLVGLHTGRTNFKVHDAGPRLEVEVEAAGRSHLKLRAEARAGLVGSVFGGVREANEELLRWGPLAGASALLGPGERARLVPRGQSLEPLLVHTLELATPAELGGERGLGFEVDSAFRLVDRTRRPVRASLERRAHRATGDGEAALAPALCSKS